MVRALALQARGHWFESSCFHQNNRGFPLGFLLPSTAFCAAQRRAPFGRSRDKSLLTLAQTAPAASALRRSATFVCIPLPHAPLSSPFCSRCSVAPLLTSPVVSTKNPLNSDFFFAREMPVSGFDRKIRAKWRQCCVGKRCRNSEYPSSKRDFRHGTHLPESQKSKKQPFRRTVVSW